MHDASSTSRLRLLHCSLLHGSSLVKTFWPLSLVLVASILFNPIARAAAVDDSENPDTSPASQGTGRAVRLSYLEGSVRVTQGDQVIADPAVINMPLFEGTEIATATDGRAEIQLEDGSIVRLSPNTILDFTVMQLQGTAPRTEITMRSGLAYFEAQPSNAEHRLRIRYDDASFTASEPSIVRITHDAPPAELSVLSGNIRVERASALQLDVHAGESLTLDTSNLSRYNLASAIQPNSWDNWNADRDQFLSTEAADQTSATANQPGAAGGDMSDLDANGNWYNVPGEGNVWAPYDAQDAGDGWDPYGYGSWIDYPQYGYIWVSGYSWGYSPFGCGLWDYYDDFGWAWAPGRGCNPWWGYGGRGWLYRLGNNSPPGYRPPHRPRPPMHHEGNPRAVGNPRSVGPAPGGVHRAPASPVIVVDRRPSGGGVVPVSRDGGSVTIAGHSVEPLRPVGGPHQGFRPTDSDNGADGSMGNSNSGQGSVITSRGQPVNAGNHVRPGYTPYTRPGSQMEGLPASNGRPASSGTHSEPYHPMPSPSPSRPAPSSPAPHYSPPPAPAPHYSPPPASHPSPPPSSHPHH